MYTRHSLVETTLGALTLIAVDEAIVGLYFSQHWHPPSDGALGVRVDEASDPLLGRAATQLHEYLAGARRAFDLPTATRGDSFQESVWAVLRTIPFGATTTYGAIAEGLGDKAQARRVGQAVGHNPLSIIVPCHRVVGKGGKLTGFAGGLERKQRLLDLEAPSSGREMRLF